jgi:hypothetical protein
VEAPFRGTGSHSVSLSSHLARTGFVSLAFLVVQNCGVVCKLYGRRNSSMIRRIFCRGGIQYGDHRDERRNPAVDRSKSLDYEHGNFWDALGYLYKIFQRHDRSECGIPTRANITLKQHTSALSRFSSWASARKRSECGHAVPSPNKIVSAKSSERLDLTRASRNPDEPESGWTFRLSGFIDIEACVEK